MPGLNQSYANTDLSKLTSYEDVTTYNNYYEFGTGKSDPYINLKVLKLDLGI
jgi:sulfoxide reductase catalytic subunit YedY